MEFFRQNKKIIIGFIIVSFLLWTFGLGIFMLFTMGK